MDLAAAARDGISWFTHKATEATNVRHKNLGTMLGRARAAGIPVLGAYHVVRSSPSVAAQVSYFFAYLDEAAPWWRTWPGFLLQVDLEKWPYDPVTIREAPVGAGPAMPARADLRLFMSHERSLQAAGTGSSFAAELRRRAPASAFVIVYASKGQYGDTLRNIGAPLWNARYPSSSAGRYRSLYPGDDGSGWQTYSGLMPMFWQYTSSATIGSQTGCDANAFRGTLDQLILLTQGDDADMTPVQAVQLTHVESMLAAALNRLTNEQAELFGAAASDQPNQPGSLGNTGRFGALETKVSALTLGGITDEQVSALAGQIAAAVVVGHDALSEDDLAAVEASVQAALNTLHAG